MVSKNIAVIVGGFPTISQTFIVNQVNSLIESGNTVTLYSYKKGVDIKIHESLRTHDLLNKVIYFKKTPKLKISRFFSFIIWTIQNSRNIRWNLFFKALNISKYGKEAYTLKLFFESQWFLTPTNFEIIHVHFGPNAKRIANIKSKGFLPQKSKLITTFHGYGIMPNRIVEYQKEYRNLLEQSNAFTVNSIYLEGLLLELKPSLDNCYILPVGLDASFFERSNRKKENNHFDLVFCGKLIPLKGAEIAISIVKKLHDLGYKQVRLHIIGDGKLKALLNDKIGSLGLNDIVFLYGAITQKQIKQKFEESDVFLFPGIKDPETGRAETQGLVIQEAQAMELPVVVSDVGGMKYGILPNKSGFVVAENNLDGFVEAIKNLILNPELKFKMGRTGRLFVEGQYDNKVLIKILQNIYQDVTNMP